MLRYTVIGEIGVLDPDARAVMALAALANRPPFPVLGPVEARKALAVSRAALGGTPPPVLRRDLSVVLNGAERAMRLYRPPGAGERLPLAVYFHGGGWVLGDLDYGDWFCASLADRLGVAVLNLDYRLAPEHPFPAAVEDAVAALDWAGAQAETLGALEDRIAVVGDSAGGNLAAVCALHARDAGRPLRAQVLIYPAVDMAMASGSYRRNADGYLLTAKTMGWFKGRYLAGADERDWRASPCLAELAGVSPALVVSGGFDVLSDEAHSYADRLAAAGVPVRHVHFAGQLHGFLMWPRLVRQSQEALGVIVDELRARLFD